MKNNTKQIDCIHDDDPAIKLKYKTIDCDLYLRCPKCGVTTFLRPLTFDEIEKDNGGKLFNG